jgi:hypothetical protein
MKRCLYTPLTHTLLLAACLFTAVPAAQARESGKAAISWAAAVSVIHIDNSGICM